MKEGRASLTANRVAERRAVHQLVDAPVVFEDPLAIRILRPERARHLRDHPAALDRTPLDRVLRAFVAVRSRFAEDAVRDAVASGLRQYVILGAGFDTFAYRNPYPGLRVFEVDHPATQHEKQQRLAAASIAIPPSLTLVPLDFTRGSLQDALHTAGFDPRAPAVFAWLGVVAYLELEEIRATLGFIASLARDTSVIFDYGTRPSGLNLRARLILKVMAMGVAAAGEPWKSFFDPPELRRELARAGLALVCDAGRDELNARYFAGRTDDLRAGPFARIAHARVS